MKTVILLLISNTFMTFAWYWHLKFTEIALWKVVLISWGIAFFEYMLMVPANRFGHLQFSGFQLKIIQEIISITVFVAFALFYLKEPLKLNYLISFALIVLAVYFALKS